MSEIVGMKSHCTRTSYLTKGPAGNAQMIPEMTEEEFRKLAHEQGLDTSSKITVRIIAFLKNSETVNSAHEIYEFDPTLSYAQLRDCLTRFLLKHAHNKAEARANLGVIFTPEHHISQIKAIWAGLPAGLGDVWVTGNATINPSNDVVVTEANWDSILNILKKRDAHGSLDTLAIEIETKD